MNLNPDQIAELKNLLAVTHDKEIHCDECLEHVGEYAEHTLLGKAIPKALLAVEQHLAVCIECREEYQSLLDALRELEQEK